MFFFSFFLCFLPLVPVPSRSFALLLFSCCSVFLSSCLLSRSIRSFSLSLWSQSFLPPSCFFPSFLVFSSPQLPRSQLPTLSLSFLHCLTLLSRSFSLSYSSRSSSHSPLLGSLSDSLSLPSSVSFPSSLSLFVLTFTSVLFRSLFVSLSLVLSVSLPLSHLFFLLSPLFSFLLFVSQISLSSLLQKCLVSHSLSLSFSLVSSSSVSLTLTLGSFSLVKPHVPLVPATLLLPHLNLLRSLPSSVFMLTPLSPSLLAPPSVSHSVFFSFLRPLLLLPHLPRLSHK